MSSRKYTHTIEADFTAPNNTLHFRCLHLFNVGLSMVLCAATSAGISRLHNWYFMYSSNPSCPCPWLLIVLKILLARRACTLVISTRPTINLHATGERASVNFGHCTLLTQDSIGHLKMLCVSVLSPVVALESEWKHYSSSQSDKKMLAFEYEFSLKLLLELPQRYCVMWDLHSQSEESGSANYHHTALHIHVGTLLNEL